MVVDDYKHRGQRRGLVQLLKSKGIKNENVLKAIGAVPRHVFFESAFHSHAYQDKAFPIGEGQTISQPYTVAFQTELLELSAGDKVLEVGTGSGYQASVLAELDVKLYTIEYKEKLSLKASKVLGDMGYNIVFKHGDGSTGWIENAPYDGIIVTAGAPTVPKALVQQLKVGGRLIIPVGDEKNQKMTRITRLEGNRLSKEEFSVFAFVPLLGASGWRK